MHGVRNDERPLALQVPHIGERVQVIGDIAAALVTLSRAECSSAWTDLQMTGQQLSRLLGPRHHDRKTRYAIRQRSRRVPDLDLRHGAAFRRLVVAPAQQARAMAEFSAGDGIRAHLTTSSGRTGVATRSRFDHRVGPPARCR